MPDDDDAETAWRAAQQRERCQIFFAENWPKSGVPKRAADRIAKNDLRGDQWHIADGQIEGLLADGKGALLALVGTRGPGKTQLGACAMERACQAGKSVRYIKALDFFAEIRAAYGPTAKETEREVINRFCKPKMLVIDGMEERGETKWEDRMLSHVIDRRYDDTSDTILIANLKADVLAQSIGDSAASRLWEVGGIIQCDWESFR